MTHSWILAFCICILFVTTCSGLPKCEADKKERWGYRGQIAAENWGNIFPSCNGTEQSPIDISSKTLIPNPALPKLEMLNYDIPVTKATVYNTGRSVYVTPEDGVTRSVYINESTYKLDQFHFHWGDNYNNGAEHTIDGSQYALELQFVHVNDKNELAVVGVLFHEQGISNEELQIIIDTFPEIMYKGKSTDLKKELDLNKLLPVNPASYYRYRGSLTTPECNEGVTWSVLTKPLPVWKGQMDAFRGLYSTTERAATPGCKITKNYRPVQPLNNRNVYLSQ